MTRPLISQVSRLLLPLLLMAGSVGAVDTYYSEPIPGTYSYSGGSPIALASGDRFWFRGDSAGNYTLTNDFTVNNGAINWSGGSATKVFFDGNLTLNGNLTLSSDTYGPGRRADFTGDILLVGGDRTITSITATYTSNAPTLFGTIDGGGIHSVTLKAPYTDRGMGVGGSGGWNVKNVILDTGYIHLAASNAGDDFFSGVRTNGGKVSLIGGTPVSIYKGTYDFNSDFTVTSGTITLRTNASDHEIILRNGLTLATGGLTTMAWSGGSGKVTNHVTVGNGGILTLADDNLKTLAGDLTLLGGSRLNVSYANSTPYNPRLVVETGNSLRLGDGSAATPETVVIRGLQTTAGDQNLIFRLSPASVVDDGNVTLRYETPAGAVGLRFIVAWTTPTANGVDLPFRGGSAGTVFAPDPSIKELVVAGPNSGPVFTASSPTSLVTAGKVSFYRAPALGAVNNNRIQALSSLVVADGGSFVATVTGGTVEASAITVQSGGTIGGIGTFVAPIVVQSGGNLAPGNSPGQLFVVGNLTLASGANYAVEVVTGSQVGNGITGYDQTVVNGAVSLDGANLLITADMFGLQRGQLLTIIANDGVDPVLGTFAGLPEGSTVEVGGTGFFAISYNSFDLGNDVVLRALIPEPTSLALLGLAGLLVLRRRR